MNYEPRTLLCHASLVNQFNKHTLCLTCCFCWIIKYNAAMKATITRSSKRSFFCRLDLSEQIVQATALAKHIKGREQHLVVGDRVELQHTDGDHYIIQNVQERKNEIFRTGVRERKKKVIASNVDLMVIAVSASNPTYKMGLVDRYLTRSFLWGIPAIVVFNKMDQYQEDSFDIMFAYQRIQDHLQGAYEVSAIDPNRQPRYLKEDFFELKKILKNKVSIFLGQSGVGKSKLISALTDGKVSLVSGRMGKEGKGTHTTTWAELIGQDDFYFIDSPGVRSNALYDLTTQQVWEAFWDLHPIMAKCHFNDCQHQQNTKGCAFHQIQTSHPQQAKYLLSRLESYQKLIKESQSIPDWKRNL